jgi:hypothetical protein
MFLSGINPHGERSSRLSKFRLSFSVRLSDFIPYIDSGGPGLSGVLPCNQPPHQSAVSGLAIFLITRTAIVDERP